MSTPIYPMIIGGQEVLSDQKIDVVNPKTGEVFAQVPEIDELQVEQALDAAKKGFETWSSMPWTARKGIIENYAKILHENREEIIELLIAETGKPRDNAEYDFGMILDCLKFFPEEAERLDQPVLQDPDGRFLHYMQRQPLGVVVGFLAWNFPLLNVAYKIGPVLAAGCSVILKPATITPVASLKVASLAKVAGIPDGVINVISSSDHDVTKGLLESDIPELVTMIGSTRAGLEVMKNSCTSIKHFSVELGGNAPVVVYADANVQEAAQKIISLKFANCGQVCVSPNRCFVHESVYDEFVKYAQEETAKQEVGPMMSDKERQRVLALVKEAQEAGAEIVTGGSAVEGNGFYMEPTLLKNAKPEMKICKDEIFGPVMPIISFSDADDEIALANNTEFGLAAYVFTQNLGTGLRAARDIQAGSVCVNEPHYSVHLPHGGLKQSGIGKDCSKYSLEEYLTLKRVSVLIEK